ncbi:virulence factor SrfB [Pseudomonas sp. CFBP 8770]|uniref:virulence factor SrfB n=1 Tax=unclassified Pseudomonas TaxID=196821 RepID=UPI00177D90C0|nr:MULTISPECIES: virulence factor SrfB [unclassified Pseudomonas]MBD8472991.1 virulence factor SrfB [Pseudomonas sp. CFBP 8773]MBD8645906.1 virulence factor SrfB [Pseudomonas sp. CFBP 8770]
MLTEVTQFEDTVSLVSDTGVQFLDFALRLDVRKEQAGEFAPMTDGLICRLVYNEEKDFFFYEPEAERIEKTKPVFSIDMRSSLELLDGLWLPLPFFRFMPPHRFDEGPTNWARMRIVKLPVPDIDGNSHRLTMAFDSRVMPKRDGTAYLAPNEEDISSGVSFKLATKARETRWFLAQGWVNEWLLEVFNEGNAHRSREELDIDIRAGHHLAHYLNVLSLLGSATHARQQNKTRVEIPELKVVANDSRGQVKPIPVDLVLDVGNSRTCGILIENHGQAGSGLKQNYVLELRDLITPEHTYNQPFESRVEFSQAYFGKDHCSVKSGRHDAFQWATIARVGSEASRLASRRRGTEGSTGLSSPKRYLWDENPYGHGWRFNCSYIKTDNEPYATAAPFSHLINETGEALYTLDDDDRLPVFMPRYSRSSLMTFMLAEVLAQALSQINSPAQRSRQGHTRVPRQLKSITLTVPPGMPQAERNILNERVQQAIGLVWKSMGWHAGEEDPQTDELTPPRTPVPSVRVEWDEASCGQLVYLYTEINENFAGHPEEFFDTLARPDKTDRERITLATIDIGGGTTDLVITDYRLDRAGSVGSGSNVHIVPEQRFRDGFKVAGDDILLDVIQDFVLPSFEKALLGAGVQSPGSLMSRLCGDETASAQDMILRQQLNLQVFTPLGLALLKAYEQYDPETPADICVHSYRDLLGDKAIGQAVLEYVQGAVRREVGALCTFELFDTSITFDLQKLHAAFLNDQINISKILGALCEVIFHYPCDVLLLTGRPSRLPGVQAFIRKMLPLPPGRILPLQNYRTGGWYPFHKSGLIDDPKSTASVGAMLCLLCANHSVPNFYFRSSALKPYSTVKHIGVIDLNNVIKDADVLYRDVQSHDGKIQLPLVGTGDDADSPQLEMRGDLRLGFRQLAAERWAASPLYTLRFTAAGRDKFSRAVGTDDQAPLLKVRFEVKAPDKHTRKHGLVSDRLTVAGIESNSNNVNFNPRSDLELELNTMLDAGLSETKYWLDSGSVKRK